MTVKASHASDQCSSQPLGVEGSKTLGTDCCGRLPSCSQTLSSKKLQPHQEGSCLGPQPSSTLAVSAPHLSYPRCPALRTGDKGPCPQGGWDHLLLTEQGRKLSKQRVEPRACTRGLLSALSAVGGGRGQLLLVAPAIL